MSDSFLVEEDFLDKDYFLDAQVKLKDENEVKSERRLKIIKLVFCLLCFLLLGELIIYKYVLPCFASPKITIMGNENYRAEEIASFLLPMNSSNWFNFNVEDAVTLISSESGIESVSVEKHFPDKILVKVQERKPVALMFVMENGHSVPLQIDKNGVLFKGKMGKGKNGGEDSSSEKNVRENLDAIPIISGLPIEYMAQGMKIPNIYKPLFDQIYTINNLPQKYFASVSEICVLPNDFGNYELELIPSHSKVKVRTDRSLNEDALKYMIVVLDVVNQIGTDVDKIDLRYGSVSYTLN